MEQNGNKIGSRCFKMKYLRIKAFGKSKKKRKNGTYNVIPIFVEKNRKYGSVICEEAISRKRPILITGAHQSGKTHFLERLHESALDIWGGHTKAKAKLLFSSLNPISSWVESPALIEWYEKQEGQETPWKKLRAWEKTDLLPEFCKKNRAVVFLDDAHKLTGRKMDIAKKCVMAAKICVATASEEGRLPPSLRQIILLNDPQIIRLDSDVAYDMTSILMWIMMAAAIGTGAYEIAMALGGLKMLASGRRATKQE